MKDGPDQGEERLEVACRAVRESGCDFIKTSTGFHPAGGASVEAVRLMKKYGEGIKVKASGGIRDLATARAMLDAGADRLGLSASIQIVNELKGSGGTDGAGRVLSLRRCSIIHLRGTLAGYVSSWAGQLGTQVTPEQLPNPRYRTAKTPIIGIWSSCSPRKSVNFQSG